jgi:hypothetical protein
MQLLAALDQIAEAFRAAMLVATALVVAGMIVHGAALLMRRVRARASRRAKAKA